MKMGHEERKSKKLAKKRHARGVSRGKSDTYKPVTTKTAAMSYACRFISVHILIHLFLLYRYQYQSLEPTKTKNITSNSDESGQ